MAVSVWGQTYIQAAMPQENPVQVGSLWIDTSGTPLLKLCTSISPYTFAAISSAAAWGDITGTLANQTDLQTALDAKTALTTFNDHSARHENGGADEISVAGLSGLLGDSQNALAHKTSHENNGTDEISVAGLSGLLADAQTPLSHNHAASEITSGSLADARRANPVEQTTTSTGTVNNLSLDAKLTHLRCDNASALTVTGFSIGGSAPTDGDCVIITNVGSSTVKVTHQGSGSTEAHRNITISTAGQIIGAGGRMVGVYDGTTDRWRITCDDPGAPIVVAYASGDYTASAGTWTVESADLTTFTYVQRGKVVNVAISISSSSTGTGMGGTLIVAMPGGFSVARDTGFSGIAKDNGTWGSLSLFVQTANPTTLRFFRSDLASWGSSSTNNTNLFAQCFFEVD